MDSTNLIEVIAEGKKVAAELRHVLESNIAIHTRIRELVKDTKMYLRAYEDSLKKIEHRLDRIERHISVPPESTR